VWLCLTVAPVCGWQAYEAFVRDAVAAGVRLEEEMRRTLERFHSAPATTPRELMAQHKYIHEAIFTIPDKVITEGTSLKQKHKH
jgi:hypothetical protein